MSDNFKQISSSYDEGRFRQPIADINPALIPSNSKRLKVTSALHPQRCNDNVTLTLAYLLINVSMLARVFSLFVPAVWLLLFV